MNPITLLGIGMGVLAVVFAVAGKKRGDDDKPPALEHKPDDPPPRTREGRRSGSVTNIFLGGGDRDETKPSSRARARSGRVVSLDTEPDEHADGDGNPGDSGDQHDGNPVQ